MRCSWRRPTLQLVSTSAKAAAPDLYRTTALFFALLNLIKVPGFLYTGVLDVPLLLSLWWVFAFIPLGIWVARLLIMPLNQQVFENIIVVLLLLSSVWLLWQSR